MRPKPPPHRPATLATAHPAAPPGVSQRPEARIPCVRSHLPEGGHLRVSPMADGVPLMPGS